MGNANGVFQADVVRVFSIARLCRPLCELAGRAIAQFFRKHIIFRGNCCDQRRQLPFRGRHLRFHAKWVITSAGQYPAKACSRLPRRFAPSESLNEMKSSTSDPFATLLSVGCPCPLESIWAPIKQRVQGRTNPQRQGLTVRAYPRAAGAAGTTW